jgi:hypothetical protein
VAIGNITFAVWFLAEEQSLSLTYLIYIFKRMESFRTLSFIFQLNALKWLIPWSAFLRKRYNLIILLFFTLFRLNAQLGVSIDCSTLFGGESPYGSNLTQEIRSWKVLNGSTYVLGKTLATSFFPSTDGSEVVGTEDYFIAKFDGQCNVVFARILNGVDDCQFHVEGDYVYLVGTVNQLESTYSAFNVTNGTVLQGDADLLYCKISVLDGSLEFGSLFGGSGSERLLDMTYDAGVLYVLMGATSGDLPVTNNSTKFSGSGMADIVLLGVSNSNQVSQLAYVGPAGSYSAAKGSVNTQDGDVFLVVEKSTSSLPDWPVTDGSAVVGSGNNLFLTKMDAGGVIEFANRIYAHDSNVGTIDLYLGADGAVVLFGTRVNSPYSSTDGSILIPSGDHVAIKVSLGGQLVYRSFLNLNGVRSAYGDGELYVMGTRDDSQVLTTTNGSSPKGLKDVYVKKIDGEGGMVYSSYLGGSGDDMTYFSSGASVMKVVGGALYFVLESSSVNFPVTDGSIPQGIRGPVFGRINPSGNLDFSTCRIQSAAIGTWSGENIDAVLEIENDQLYAGVQTYSSPGSYPVTTISANPYQGSLGITKINLCSSFNSTLVDSIVPSNQTVCMNGVVGVIRGDKIFVEGGDLSTIFIDGQATTQPDLEARYQWQYSLNSGGPWVDIPGGIYRHYTPQPTVVTTYFRRLAMESVDCGNDTISVSSISVVSVNNFTAPVVSAGGIYHTCPGQTVAIESNVTGGLAPYLYDWDMGVQDIEDPEVSPNQSSVFTLVVTDGNGCKQLDQALVRVWKAEAGPLTASVCAGVPVVIGGNLGPAPNGSSFLWAPASGLSCVTCPQPAAA